MRFTVPSDHPCLPGHFPGQPVVPGVVLLAHAFEAIGKGRPAMPPVGGIETVKFLAPVLAGDEVAVTWREAVPGRIDFTCASAGRTVLRGRALLADPS